MAYAALDQRGESATAKRCSWSAATSSCASRSRTAVVTRVRFLRAPSLSLLAASRATGSTRRSSRSNCAGHLEASTADGRTASEIRQKQWLDHWSDRNRRLESISAHPEEAWLSRVKRVAHFKSTLPIGLIAYLSPSWHRLTTFWFPVASAPLACA